MTVADFHSAVQLPWEMTPADSQTAQTEVKELVLSEERAHELLKALEKTKLKLGAYDFCG